MSSTLVILFDFCGLGRKEVTLISEDVEPRRALGATADRHCWYVDPAVSQVELPQHKNQGFGVMMKLTPMP